MALACLSVEEMTPEEESSRNMEVFAQLLKSWESKTGCVMGVDVITRALRLLDRGWNERLSIYDKKDRNHMPEWSRYEGFPSTQPIVPDEVQPGLHVGDRLYDALERLTFSRNPIDGLDWDPDRDGSPIYTVVHLPRRKK